MSSDQSIWYSLGYAFERARSAPSEGKRKLASLRDRHSAPTVERERPTHARRDAVDDLLVSGAVVAMTRALERWIPRRHTGLVGLLRAAAAGAGAALLLELVRPLLRGDARLPSLDSGTVDRLVAGAGQGLVYGAVVEPRVPGPALLKGALYGSAEYAADPLGGLYRLLGRHAPLRRIPGVGALLDDLDPHDRAYLEHITFGIALSLLYESGSSPRSNGITSEEEE